MLLINDKKKGEERGLSQFGWDVPPPLSVYIYWVRFERELGTGEGSLKHRLLPTILMSRLTSADVVSEAQCCGHINIVGIVITMS